MLELAPSVHGTEETLIGERYRVEQELARGGMGVVYRVRDESTGRSLALKRMLRDKLERPSHLALFQRECRTLASLRHPRIIAVYDYGCNFAGPHYTMELLSGADLKSHAPLHYREACRHLRDIACSLALLHAHKLVHRDVAPRNVRITEEGRAKLIDFGALTDFGKAEDAIGTPSCTAPEVLDHG